MRFEYEVASNPANIDMTDELFNAMGAVLVDMAKAEKDLQKRKKGPHCGRQVIEMETDIKLPTFERAEHEKVQKSKEMRALLRKIKTVFGRDGIVTVDVPYNKNLINKPGM